MFSSLSEAELDTNGDTQLTTVTETVQTEDTVTSTSVSVAMQEESVRRPSRKRKHIFVAEQLASIYETNAVLKRKYETIAAQNDIEIGKVGILLFRCHLVINVV